VPDPVTIALVYPDLLGTYGDGGNATVLAQRLRWRGIAAEVLPVTMGTPLPASCALYVLGGGEDSPQSLAAGQLRDGGGLLSAVGNGAVVLAVCAGLQVVGSRFRAGDRQHDGLGLVDAETVTALPRRAVGELLVEPTASLGLAALTGYENHASATSLGPDVQPLGRVRSGCGNGTPAGLDGFVAGHVVGTYLHGPVLARNPALADLLLTWVVGELPEGDERLSRADAEVAELRRERLAAALGEVRTWARSRRRPWRRTPRS
jgi:CobQ-like glutamine amidotransferase family enzyme